MMRLAIRELIIASRRTTDRTNHLSDVARLKLQELNITRECNSLRVIYISLKEKSFRVIKNVFKLKEI
jgi:hypothetical protein